MLGLLIVTLAIGGSIFGTILLSADENTYQVTKYDYKADVTGLFKGDNTPEFYEFDLSRNYTGYYINSTVFNGVKYWGGASFTKASGVNNYPINNLYTSVHQQDYTFTEDVSGFFTVHVQVLGQSGTDFNGQSNVTNYSAEATFISLENFVNDNHLDGYDKITITPIDNQVSNRVLFIMNQEALEAPDIPTIFNPPLTYVEYDYRNTYISQSGANAEDVLTACLSCEINVAAHTVNYYYTTNANNDYYVKTVDLSYAYLLFGPSHVLEPPITGFGMSAHVLAVNYPPKEYMDISQGVRITGGS